MRSAQDNSEAHRTTFIEPVQRKPVTALPAGENWTFEIKFDGYRCIAVKRGRAVTLFSRNEKVLNNRFPGVLDTLASRLRSRRRTGCPRFTRKTFNLKICNTLIRSHFTTISTLSIYCIETARCS